jgi:outer membrane receptor protein involved in Fe transport
MNVRPDAPATGSPRQPGANEGTAVAIRVSVLAAVLAAATTGVHAQSQNPTSQGATRPPAKAAPAAKDPGNKTVDAVTVTGASQNGYRSSIDRRSYGVANDLATTTGAISDALKNIPSVEVDVNGNVSLRGDTNVTILIDGKPSGLFKGASAAQALQAMPADSVERVEVITNPSAAFSPEGSAGVINLITKQTRKPGKSGSLRVNLGTSGRENAGMTLAYNSNKLTLSADANARRDTTDGHGGDSRTILDGHGDVLSSSESHYVQRGGQDQRSARTGVDYDLTDATRLSGELRYFHFGVDADSHTPFQGFGPTGAATTAFNQHFNIKIQHDTDAAQASLRHKFAGDDHVLTVNLSRERTDEDRTNILDQVFSLPAAPDFFTRLRSRSTLTLTEAKADYTWPLPDEAKLKAGYDLRIDENDYDNVGVRGTGPADIGPDPTQTNLFLYKQTINAAYATYERRFGEWTALAGLRLEEVQLNLDQVTANLVHDTAYFKVYPSLHLAYQFDPDKQLILSYSKRVQRPNPQDLNPFRVENDPLNFRSGNADLQPQITHSFEAGYQYKAGQTFYLATLYYRQNEHGVTDVLSNLGNGVFLASKANLSESKAAGLELVANGHLTKTLSYNVSTNLYWNQIDATGRGLGQVVDFARRRSGFQQGGRANLNWQPTPNDQVQLGLQLNAKRLLPQGYSDPNALTFLGYRHKFNDSLSLVVTAQDLFGTFHYGTTIDTPTLRERYAGKPAIQAAFIGFNWNFGQPSKKPRDQGFDFGGAAPGP